MPLLEDEPVAPPPPRHRFGRRSTRRTLIGLAARLAIFALVLGFLWGGWYLARKGFGRQWRNRLVEELHKRGVEVSLRRLTLDPFRGLIARPDGKAAHDMSGNGHVKDAAAIGAEAARELMRIAGPHFFD